MKLLHCNWLICAIVLTVENFRQQNKSLLLKSKLKYLYKLFLALNSFSTATWVVTPAAFKHTADDA